MDRDKNVDPGSLYLVATPIGNLNDISSRALTILHEVDLIACEDTRHSKKLLSHFGIATPLMSYFREKEQQRASVLLKKLADGLSIALITDAGTPGISDPGSVVVRLARQNDFPVIPVPGPSALTAVLSVAGLAQSSFYFGGFPPAKSGQRKKFFTSLAALPCPLIFYESPHRIHACLKDCLEIFGNREAQLFRELTKIHEEYLSGSLADLCKQLPEKIKGELVFVINQGSAPQVMPEDLDTLLAWYKDSGSSLKDSATAIASHLGLPRKEVYRKALAFWHDDN